MEYNGIQFLRPDPFLSEGITFLRHDPDWRPHYIPLQTRLTKRHSGQPLMFGMDEGKGRVPVVECFEFLIVTCLSAATRLQAACKGIAGAGLPGS